jgi:hypothetical protein
MKRALFLMYGQPEGGMTNVDRQLGNTGLVDFADLYELDALALPDYAAVFVSMHVDQRYLATHADMIDRYLRQGGTVVANGHIAYPFLRDLTAFTPLRDYNVDDLRVKRQTPHPVWDGVAELELTFRRGVAGFYGRGGHQPPAGATVVHTIGARGLTVDFAYPVGRGRVLFHGGNDLWQFGNAKDTTARIVPQLFEWIYAKG